MCLIIYPLFPQSQWPWSLQTPVCPLEQVHWCPLWQSARLKKVMDTHLHIGKHVSNINSFFNNHFKGNVHVYKITGCNHVAISFFFSITLTIQVYNICVCLCFREIYQIVNKSTLQESTFKYSTCFKLKMVRKSIWNLYEFQTKYTIKLC